MYIHVNTFNELQNNITAAKKNSGGGFGIYAPIGLPVKVQVKVQVQVQVPVPVEVQHRRRIRRMCGFEYCRITK
jgi:hypothetical protein